ncbi:hypothetical protein ACMGDH_05185 [Sphingomonas sp. DT-207]|uniref:hypothetical protein n=1 Tax=Sphingomonas sp. DT-207 TaxID=3396167 RepID=UPI003F1BFE39
MNAQTETLPAEPAAPEVSGFDYAAYHGFRPAPGATRHEGWTPDKQRTFLEAVSEGYTVIQACEIVGLSKQSAYALRGSPRGAGFALGWDAAVIKARDALADELMERAFRGQRDKVDDDGRIITRHRFDNRLALAMLGRLDRMADAEQAPSTAAAARLVACDFAQYLDLIGRDAGPARAGVFLGARLPAGVEPASDDDLAPIRTLARADRWLRTHTDIAEPLDIADLDPAERASWTGEQWNRAEAAGLVAVAPPPPENVESSQASQPAPPPEPASLLDDLYAPVWWDEHAEEWRTRFPAPEDFDGDEQGDYGDDDYSRELTLEEAKTVAARCEEELAALRAGETLERTAWFAALAGTTLEQKGEIAAGAEAVEVPEPTPAPVSPEPVEGRGPAEDPGFDKLSPNGELPTIGAEPVEGPEPTPTVRPEPVEGRDPAEDPE